MNKFFIVLKQLKNIPSFYNHYVMMIYRLTDMFSFLGIDRLFEFL